MKNYIYSLMTDEASGFVASVLKIILYLASLLYLLGIKIIFRLRRHGLLPTEHLQAQVISVGNLTLGGTGKTPLVELIARFLIEKNKKVVILTRGYKLPVKDEDEEFRHKPFLFEEIGDEPALLRLKLPRHNRTDRHRQGQKRPGSDH